MTYADEKLRKRLKLWMKWTATGDRPLPKRQGWNERGLIRSDPFWKLVSRLKFTEDAPRFCHSAELQNPTVKSRLRRRVARRRVLENPDPSVAAIATKLGEFSANIGKLNSACLNVTLAAPAIFHRPDKNAWLNEQAVGHFQWCCWIILHRGW